MIKRMITFCIAMVLLFGTATAQAEVVIRTNRKTVNASNTGDFFELHPDVKIDSSDNTYFTTVDGMITALITNSSPYDIFYLDSGIDYRKMMEKGYCLDLSSNEVIRDAIEKLYPVYREQCIDEEGHIYAIPQSFQFDYLSFNTEILQETGFELEEVPSTFPEFLDFLEDWIAYTQDEYCDTAILGLAYWGDAQYYTEYSYAEFLVDRLLSQYIMQKEKAGEQLRFSDPELIALLERCVSIGKELFTYDLGCNAVPSVLSAPNGGNLGTDNSTKEILYLRISEDQPKLIEATLRLCAAYAGTEHPEEVIALMQALLENNEARYDAYFYQDGEPVQDPNYEKNLAHQQELINETEQQLARNDLDLSERDELTWRLEDQQEILDGLLYNEEKRYTVTSAELSRYRDNLDALYIKFPDAFDIRTDAGMNVNNLEARFYQGQMTAEELVKELDRVAKMVEMEEGM